MKDIANKAESYLKDAHGAVLPLIAMSIAVLILFAAVSVDGGRYFMARSKLTTALDAAVIAAADIATNNLNATPQGKAEIKERARQFFRANFPEGYMGTAISDDDLVINYDTTTGTVTGEVAGNLPITFGGLFQLGGGGAIPDVDISAYSEVVRATGGRLLEIAIAVDQSNSMCNTLSTGQAWGVAAVSDPNCENYTQVKNSINTLINTVTTAVTASNGPINPFFSFIPFSHDVRINNDTTNFQFLDTRQTPANIDRMKSVLGLTDDAQRILDMVDMSVNSAQELPTEGGTNYPLGLWWAWASLSDTQIGRFTGISAHQDTSIAPSSLTQVASRASTKVIVMLTDGDNYYPSRDRTPPHAKLSGDANGYEQDIAADARLNDICNQIKAEDTLLCTIAFNVPANSDVATNLSSCATQNCAFNAQDFTSLQQAFDEIGNFVIEKRITQ
jgi:Putative Flp pilus-assembly TadE/G-like